MWWKPASDDIIDIVGEPGWHLPSFRMHSCNARDQVACSAAAGGWQSFERPTPAAFADAVHHAGDGLVIDVGANTGFYSLLAVSVSADVGVVAYEPYAPVRQRLQANLRLSPRRRAIKVCPFAASDTAGDKLLYVPDGSHGLVETSASLWAEFKASGTASARVKAVRLDDQHAGRRRVAVIKVDAEGHDLEVLQGAAGILQRDRPILFLEVLLRADEAGLTRLLHDHAYVDVTLLPDAAPLVLADTRHHTLAWNRLWLPREEADNFLQRFASSGG
jgi:FkbM family methyltransferase